MTSDDFSDDLDTPTEDDLNDCYGSKYLSAADLGDRKIRTHIGKIRKEVLQQQGGKPERPKFVIYFTTLDKPLVLNATNKDTLVKALGGTPASWVGAEIGLFSVSTQYGGKATKGVRFKVLSEPKAAAKPAPKPAPKAAADPMPWDAEDPGFQGTDFNEAAE